MNTPREHPVGCDCATCLGDGAPLTFAPPADSRNDDPFLVEDELDGLHCPKCGAENPWKGRTESQRLCGECRYVEE